MKSWISHHHIFILLSMIGVLTTFTHLYNPLGFPAGPSNDESIYMRRTIHVLAGQGPQEGSLYDHPYFSQLFLAGALGLIEYPNSFNLYSWSIQSVEMLYLAPRIIMGILAIVDTFFIYKISENLYGQKIALTASILFAVMPLTWLIRRIWLESIQLPFILGSILFATYLKDSSNKTNLAAIFSGISLGLAILTKIPAITMVPLVAFLLCRNRNNLKSLRLWFVAIVLIPLIWPTYALYSGQFNLWLSGVLWQMHRGINTFFDSFKYDFNIDPLFMILGISGAVFCILKRDFFLLFWFTPFLVFLYVIGFVSYWHLVPLLAAFCIAAARLLEFLSKIVSRKKTYQKLSLFVIITTIGIFGLVSTTVLIIPINLNSAYFETAAFIIKYLLDATGTNKSIGNDMTVISNPFYSWIPQSILHLNYNYIDYYNGDISIKTHKVLLVVDSGLTHMLKKHEAAKQIERNFNLYTRNLIASFEGGINKSDKVSIYFYDSKPSEMRN